MVFRTGLTGIAVVERGGAMQKHRPELLRSASRRIRRGGKATGRIVVSAFHQIDDALAPDIAEPPIVPPTLPVRREGLFPG